MVPPEMTSQQVILDVSHNFQGMEALLNRISFEYPNVKSISVAFAISKKKKLDEVLALFQKDKRVQSLHIVGRPHFKLMNVEEAHDKLS